ncbi:hypothetical protein Plim_2003 [Planctopirus limnophila DSM 3776]|uniref:Squalene cyclase C-terminal domain-containing protein n=2 Tax=Planctopirus limnophila TaxID=120 RepID=D5SYQ1_PLAL2|nr:hypothetical protein Plim_2003 [Planctopirus limnophila DSM 3776]
MTRHPWNILVSILAWRKVLQRPAIICVIWLLHFVTGCDSQPKEDLPTTSDRSFRTVSEVAAKPTKASSDSVPDQRYERCLKAWKHGVRWLLNQQQADGGWHSEVYGVMQGGVGQTALTLDLLTRSEGVEGVIPPIAIRRGIDFLTKHVDEMGLVQGPGRAADYPVHATALLLRALSRTHAVENSDLSRQLTAALQASQRIEAQGWIQSDPDFGGWGALNDRAPQIDTTSERSHREGSPSNTSVTRMVLMALAAADGLTTDITRDAETFLGRCRVNDPLQRGVTVYFFTPDPINTLNKRGFEISADQLPQARPYPTATWDGLMARKICLQKQFPELHRPTVEPGCAKPLPFSTVNEGESFKSPDGDAGLDYYEASQWAELRVVIPSIIDSAEWDELIRRVLDRQRADGRWENDQREMREDDPLIATPFALMALGQWLSEHHQ